MHGDPVCVVLLWLYYSRYSLLKEARTVHRYFMALAAASPSRLFVNGLIWQWHQDRHHDDDGDYDGSSQETMGKECWEGEAIKGWFLVGNDGTFEQVGVGEVS